MCTSVGPFKRVFVELGLCVYFAASMSRYFLSCLTISFRGVPVGLVPRATSLNGLSFFYFVQLLCVVFPFDGAAFGVT